MGYYFTDIQTYDVALSVNVQQGQYAFISMTPLNVPALREIDLFISNTVFNEELSGVVVGSSPDDYLWEIYSNDWGLFPNLMTLLGVRGLLPQVAISTTDDIPSSGPFQIPILSFIIASGTVWVPVRLQPDQQRRQRLMTRMQELHIARTSQRNL